jgi:hypothetical protein
VSPIVGCRGLSSKGPILAKLVYAGNSIGAFTSLLAAFILLYSSWLML